MTGNTILNAGGTSGISLGLARRFHADGNTGIIAGRRPQRLADIAAGHDRMDAVVLDVTDADSSPAGVGTVTTEQSELNGMINKVDLMPPEALTDPGHLRVAAEAVTTSPPGPIHRLFQCVPLLTTQPEAAIVSVSSGPAFAPLPLTPTYRATKAPIHSFTESLRVQLTDTSVAILELIPPSVQTALMGQADDERSLTRDAFLDETLKIPRTQTGAVEICVDRVRFLRDADAQGRHGDLLTTLSGAH